MEGFPNREETASGATRHDWKELERQDEEARRQSAIEEAPEVHDDASRMSPDILDYTSYLSHQSYYDDLKHVDFPFIDYGAILDDSDSRLVVEQDKTLGKGGICWDAAFCLGEHLIRTQADWMANFVEELVAVVNVVELGCGTGLCGMMVAKGVDRVSVTLTDLPPLLLLIRRNILRNFTREQQIHSTETTTHDNLQQNETEDQQQHSGDICSSFTSQPPPSTTTTELEKIIESLVGDKRSKGSITTFALDWLDVVAAGKYQNSPTFDVVLGADVVATLYDPEALAKTIYYLVKDEKSLVFISFKERLTTLHRQFEAILQTMFHCIEFIYQVHSRNGNPHVAILVAQGKKTTRS